MNISFGIILCYLLTLRSASSASSSSVTCPDIESIKYADITISTGSPYKVGTVANFTCDYGFKGIGESSVICMENGRWSGSMPYCVAYRCKRKLKRVGKGHKCPKPCRKDEDCRSSFNKCECDDWCGKSCYNPNAECPNLHVPANGYILENGRSYGQTVTYGCGEGYMLTGPSTRRCRSDRKWSGFEPLCVPFRTCGLRGQEYETKLSPKVIEGTNAKKGAWPWQALLFHNSDSLVNQIYNAKSRIGGGSIINEEWILTAAHVFNIFDSWSKVEHWGKRFLIAVGMTTVPRADSVFPENIHIFEPNTLYIHPKFNKQNWDYDAALIRIGKKLIPGKSERITTDTNQTSGRFVFTRYIRPVCLPCMKRGPLEHVDLWKNYDEGICKPGGKQFTVAAGTSVMVTGFGFKRSRDQPIKYLPGVLQEGLLKIVDRLHCFESVRAIQSVSVKVRFTNRMFCATSADETSNVDSCQGDSGGPVVKRTKLKKNAKFWTQIGIVSWGLGCGDKHPGFYTSVYAIMDWVSQTLDNTKIATEKNCTLSYCHNDGTCIERESKPHCNCPARYTGSRCEIDLNPCYSSQCQNGGSCVDIGGTEYRCNCPSGYTGHLCEHEDVNPCSFSGCQNGGTCVDIGGIEFRCNCKPEYTGYFCEELISVPPDKCTTSYCLNDGTCVEHQTGLHCICPARFTGDRCQTDVNPCSSSPCQNGGTCVDIDGIKFLCNCPSRYTGYRCDVEDVNPCSFSGCQNGGTCVDIGGIEFRCNCPPEYTGYFCEELISVPPDKCTTSYCLNDGTCVEHQTGLHCICPAGFTGDRCQTDIQCQPVDPPIFGTLVKTPPTPSYEVGSVVEFSCNKGLSLQSGPISITCEPNGKWSSTERPVCRLVNPCSSSPCQNDGTCVDIGGTEFRCNCSPGYTGYRCEDEEWGPWSTWTSCTVTCGGGGEKRKSRKCRLVPPLCSGVSSIRETCKMPRCHSDIWSPWTRWSRCSRSGRTRRLRLCIGSGNCVGKGLQVKQCDTNAFSD